MNCPKCSAYNPDDALFCSVCGERMDAPAPNSLFEDNPTPPPYGGAPQAPGYGNTPVPPYAPQTPPAPGYGPNYGAPGYNNQGYGPAQKPGDASKNWAAILGLVLGILCIPCCYIGILFELFGIPFMVSLLFIIPAIIFNIIGFKSQKKGLAIAGIVCAGVGLLLAVFYGVAMVELMLDPNSEFYQMIEEFQRQLGI